LLHLITFTDTCTHGTTPLDSDNTKHSRETFMYALGEIQTRNPSKRVAADRRLRSHRNIIESFDDI